jgi:cardiolipin synthase
MEFQIFSSPKEIYKKMLADITSAKKSIYLETYIYGKDKIGNEFKKALTKKASEGVKVFLLVDAMGSGKIDILDDIPHLKNIIGLSGKIDKEDFKDLIKAGGNIRFFKEIRYVLRFFNENHERNHRKLLIIDEKISYIGSANITADCLNWRELVLKLEGRIAEHFIESFFYYWEKAGRITKKKLRMGFHKGFQIIHDLPADTKTFTADKYVRLIRSAEKEICIETPYFIPPIVIRKALAEAVRRGVKVKLLLPYKSDLGMLDLFRNRYIGRLYKRGIEIYYYVPGVLHSKLLLVDDKFFLLGSSNLDYKSFMHQHEINLFGKDKKIISALRQFFDSGINQSKLFDYNEWRSRSSLKRVIELMGSLIDEYF